MSDGKIEIGRQHGASSVYDMMSVTFQPPTTARFTPKDRYDWKPNPVGCRALPSPRGIFLEIARE